MRTRITTQLAALAIATLALLPAAAPAAGAVPGSVRTAAAADTGCAGSPSVGLVISDPGARIRDQLQSEYLRRIADDWYPAVIVQVFDVTSPAFILSRLDSEYLRGVATDWYPELLACAGAPA